MSSPWATLTLNTDAHQALGIQEARDLGARAVDHKVRLVVEKRTAGWLIYVLSWAKDQDGSARNRYEQHDLQGNLAELMHEALDEYLRRFAYTPDELIGIAAASGLDVRRA